MVIYSGDQCGTAPRLTDAWALSFLTDPPTWSQLTSAGAQPPGRDLGAVAYDGMWLNLRTAAAQGSILAAPPACLKSISAAPPARASKHA